MDTVAKAIRKRASVLAVGPSTARNQGGKGIVDVLRDALFELRLADFATSQPARFARSLDRATGHVVCRLPKRARSWGLARKCVNIYLRDCYYNSYLRPSFGRLVDEDCFEVPLDQVIADGLHSNATIPLPRWPGVKHLTPQTSVLFQTGAIVLARDWGVTRVHLDTFLWVGGR